MALSFRIATFNVENLFCRSRLLNFRDNTVADEVIVKVSEFRQELKKTVYDKPRILALYEELKEFLTIAETRARLFNRDKSKVVADGVNDWDGFIDFKEAKLSEPAIQNTARVIRSVNADICALIEVESRLTLQRFCSQRLPASGQFKRYPHQMLIDGNDDRGIDIGLASRFPIRNLRSHVDDRNGNSLIFSRDCLEAEIVLPNGRSLWLLLNHFKSKGFGSQSESNERRLRQAEQVAKILQGHKLTQDLVVVAGDLNDTPGSAPLAPLLNVANLHDVLQLQFPQVADRWTYHFEQNEQIDYLLVSKPLKAALQSAGVERRGIFKVETFSGGTIQPFDTVTKFTESASDHGAVWAQFTLP
ncbi:MAG TPA: endonuclease/exonuclease/phosphatase family protein [Blastocatellia bacterium]|nr:endonuclease/exonuclease/phosphatase family protein [Blastocatellia bacterium]